MVRSTDNPRFRQMMDDRARSERRNQAIGNAIKFKLSKRARDRARQLFNESDGSRRFNVKVNGYSRRKAKS